MKIIRLKSLSIRNFKGVKTLDITFNGPQTFISGPNGSCKSTVFDSFLWLCFGKDSSDRQDFSIKPYDQNNNVLHKVENEVSAVLEEDGVDITLKRTHREKWQKKRGSTEAEFTGNETLFEYNLVPQNATEFRQKVASIVNEKVFKLLTNPLYYNSLVWTERRDILNALAGGVTTDDIVSRMNVNGNKTELDKLVDVLRTNKTIDDYKKQIAAQKKLLKDNLQEIPTRVDEINRNLPEAVDVDVIQKQIDQKQKEIDDIDQQIIDINKSHQAEDDIYNGKRDELRGLQNRREEITREVMKGINLAQDVENEAKRKIENRIAELNQQIEFKEKAVELANKEVEADQGKVEALRVKFAAVNSEELEFGENEFICPTCKREFEFDDIDARKVEMTTAFNNDKLSRQEDIRRQGQDINVRIDTAQKGIKEKKESIVTMITAIHDSEEALKNRPAIESKVLADELQKNEEFSSLDPKINELNEWLTTPRGVDDRGQAVIDSRNGIMESMNALNKQLSSQDSITNSKQRIDVLLKEEKELAQQIADLENAEYTIGEYLKVRSDLTESRINDKFSMVRFKMFDKQINGGEIETCETLVNGVPFPDANTAAKVNAGIDIINALSSHYGITAPIFIDQREGVNELIACDSQLINLVVTTEKELTIK